MHTSSTRQHRRLAAAVARTLARALPVLATAFVLASCSDSPLGNTGDAMTDDEVLNVYGLLRQLALTSANSPPLGPFAEDLDFVSGCVTGFYSVQGSRQGEGESVYVYQLTGDVEMDFFRCQTRASAPYLTLDGDRMVRARYSFDRAGPQVLTVVIDLDGAITFEAHDGRSGRCAVNLRITISADDGPSITVTEGSICRRQGSTLGSD